MISDSTGGGPGAHNRAVPRGPHPTPRATVAARARQGACGQAHTRRDYRLGGLDLLTRCGAGSQSCPRSRTCLDTCA